MAIPGGGATSLHPTQCQEQEARWMIAVIPLLWYREGGNP